MRILHEPAPLSPTKTAPWELALIPYLVVLIQACDARIKRLEYFDRQKAVEIDRLRKAGGEQQRRRAA